ncbi:MAG: NAD-glutamate dehydrogenase domain-containing protein, partial [Longimicrobiales bacterium]
MTSKTKARPTNGNGGSVGLSSVIDDVVLALKGMAPPDELPLLEKFVPLFLAKAPPTLLEDRRLQDLAQMSMDAFRFLGGSQPDKVDVEVVNPDEDSAGWYAPVTVIRANVSERPFIVDTIREFLHAEELQIERFVYPLMTVERDKEGRITDLAASTAGESRESLVHAEVARIMDADTLDYLATETTRRLEDVVRATDDFRMMIGKIGDVVSEIGLRVGDLASRREEIQETQSFLRWLRDEAFVFLGYRAYEYEEPEGGGEKAVTVQAGSGLGVLRDEGRSTFSRPIPLSELPAGMRERAIDGPLLIISKTNAEATVHRRARMDYIGVKMLDEEGAIVGEHRFVGLFTSKAYAQNAQDIPILRQKLATILGRSGHTEGSHDYKEIITIFESMPKEELFLASEDEIEADVQTILTRYNTEEVLVSVRRDPLKRGASILVVLPRGRFSGEFRKEFEEVLVQKYHSQVLNYHLAMGQGDQARLHFYVGAPEEVLSDLDAEDLETVVHQLTQSWADEVRAGLAQRRPPDEARRLASAYNQGCAPEYKAAHDPKVAVRDILELEAMKKEGRMEAVQFFNVEKAEDDGVASDLRVYLRDEQLVLSDFMPVLENCGLRVIAVSPFVIREAPANKGAVIYSFAVQATDGGQLDVEGRGRVLSEAILAVRAGDASNDSFNRLIQHTGMAWREVEVLRAFATYAFQLGAVPSRLTLPTALDAHPEVGRLLFKLFETRFDPDSAASFEDREAKASEVRAEFAGALAEVSSLVSDRALRALHGVIEAAVRTNYYRTGGKVPTHRSGGVPYTSFKFDSARLQGISKSQLKYEVWVRSSRMEGVHLRGASVARGGIRYSDRPDDFRTEILGLVNTQMVKNSVIVPGGSKGGFVTFRSFADREAMGAEAKEQYRTLIRGLLDITDNLNGKAVPPEGVVRHDGSDPYLVVAADKGTATFSDVANALAEENGFWLGDAFASGGSYGYDHKVVGITARGGWESVKRHFREMGKDIQVAPFTVAGIGDMSGDVFGNGMLLSPVIRLIAAFDHRHVFIDPDPDPERSFAERKRMFGLGRSSWDDYDREAMSPGGMIISRNEKSVELTPEAAEALGVDTEGTHAIDGETLIRAVLRAPVELLWNGGIGTYVKCPHESQQDAGDASNDPVRIDVPDLRAAVVGEGGNLGFTQAARVEYALGGGRINTDALDNSGGVDLSDREVNLKILLSEVVKTGEVTLDERNTLLEELTDEVATLVIADNETQSLAISLEEYRARKGVDDFRELMLDLSRIGLLDRDEAGLPTREQLDERLSAHHSLTRPELAVLMAFAKLHLKAELLKGDVPDDPATAHYFFDYFPD